MNDFERDFGGVRTADSYYVDREERWGASLTQEEFWGEYYRVLYELEAIKYGIGEVML